jgi:hypothetical protein
MDTTERRQLHQDLGFLGLHAPAMAAGLLQLTAELARAKVLDQEAVCRIKDAIAEDLVLSRPRHAWRSDYESSIRNRLTNLFEEQCIESRSRDR